MDRDAVVGLLEGYAAGIAAPVEETTRVPGSRLGASGFVVATDRGAWSARAVVIATGACDTAGGACLGARRSTPR